MADGPVSEMSARHGDRQSPGASDLNGVHRTAIICLMRDYCSCACRRLIGEGSDPVSRLCGVFREIERCAGRRLQISDGGGAPTADELAVAEFIIETAHGDGGDAALEVLAVTRSSAGHLRAAARLAAEALRQAGFLSVTARPN